MIFWKTRNIHEKLDKYLNNIAQYMRVKNVICIKKKKKLVLILKKLLYIMLSLSWR